MAAILYLAHFLIGFFFLFIGFWNIYFWDKNLQVLRHHYIPFPSVALWVGILLEIICGGMIIFSIEVRTAAVLLILFTLTSINLYLPVWRFRASDFDQTFLSYFTNTTVTIGALLLLIYLQA